MLPLPLPLHSMLAICVRQFGSTRVCACVCVLAFCVITAACLLPCHDLWGFDPAFICRPGYGGPMPGGPGGYGGGPPPMYGAGFGRPPYVIPELVFFPPGLSSVWIGPVSCVPLVRCPSFCMERVCVYCVQSGIWWTHAPWPWSDGLWQASVRVGAALVLVAVLVAAVWALTPSNCWRSVAPCTCLALWLHAYQ